jgi:benzodiazapine receptor
MNNTYQWYSEIIRPSWAPPSWIFGPVWTVLYLIITITFVYIIYKVATGKLSKKALFPLSLNLISNLSFTYFQFTLMNNFLASLDILVVLGSLIWLIIYMYSKIKWVAIANIPYLLWVSFATVLQLTVTYLNW